MISNQMAVYIPELKSVVSRTELLQRKLPPVSSDGITDVQEQQTAYVISAQVGECFFDSIIVDYEQNLLTFHQVNQSRNIIGTAVLTALNELGIQEFTPRRLSYYMKKSDHNEA